MAKWVEDDEALPGANVVHPWGDQGPVGADNSSVRLWLKVVWLFRNV
jgi:hypothetical protein